ncbi:MAG: hypothetical protein AB7O97_08690 [Planctomycetota bacterium]
MILRNHALPSGDVTEGQIRPGTDQLRADAEQCIYRFPARWDLGLPRQFLWVSGGVWLLGQLQWWFVWLCGLM